MRSLHAFVSLLATVPLVAQQGTGDISISDQNVEFDVKFNQAAVTYSASTGPDWFRCDQNSTDSIFTTTWAIRVNDQPSETPIHQGLPNSPVFVNSGSAGTGFWPDFEAWGLVSIDLVYSALSTGPTTGEVLAIATVMNLDSANPITVNMFHLVDPDTCGTFASNEITPGDDEYQTVTNSGCNLVFDHVGLGSDRWEVGSYTTTPGSGVDLFTQMDDANLTTLRNDMGPFGPADIRGCFQWEDRVIPPGGFEAYVIMFVQRDLCTPTVTASQSISTACPASANGPTLSFSGTSQLGGTISIIGTGLNGTICGLVLGVEVPPLPLAAIGSTEPGSSYCISQFLTIPCPGAGTQQIDLSIPWNTECGLPVSAQWVDLISPPIDIGTSAVGTFTVGL